MMKEIIRAHAAHDVFQLDSPQVLLVSFPDLIHRRSALAGIGAGSLCFYGKVTTGWADDPLSATTVDAVEASENSRVSFDSPQTARWRIGLILETPVTCTNVVATFPVPMNWPEQQVRLLGQSVSPLITQWAPREHVGGAKQIALQINQVLAGATAELLLELEITRSRILPPQQTDDLIIPKRLPREIRNLYMGNSPFIDASHSRIRAASREIAQMEAENDWQRVEQIYDYVREHVEYVEGDLKNASEALREGKGDCEEMTSLFVAFCRNAGVPARVVWIPEHCYPEFYLEDAEGNGHWFPCQAAGTRQFGRMDEYRPVLQKGDRFTLKEKRTPVRYVSEFFRCDRKGTRNPNPRFIREQIDL